ncbi:hypothetical protein Lalb_Chr01g0012451 [Lupinus albus]|uniref:Uncharacterized protein n=1 Tax=Lupinus albus TaxID=3870 RepID=A0A6A4R5I3_LUPAL|nr:hypothetical protein Lalb_Chr01g0012451 [Lupinus albus]
MTQILPLKIFLILIQFHSITHNSHYHFNILTSKSYFSSSHSIHESITTYIIILPRSSHESFLELIL